MDAGSPTTTQPHSVNTGSVQYTVQNVPNQQVILYTHTQSRAKRVLVDFDSKWSHALGMTQIVVGVLSIIFVAVAIPMEANIDGGCVRGCYRGTPIFMIGFGYWCPIFFFISGSIALAAAKQKTSSLINALLGMSIVSVIFAFQLFISSIVALSHLGRAVDDKYRSISLAMAFFLMLCGMLEMGTSIWLSKLCGDHVCCTGMHGTVNQAPTQFVTSRNPDGSYSQSIVARQQIMLPPGTNATTYTGQVTGLATIPQGTQIVYPQGVPVNASVYPSAAPFGQPGGLANTQMVPGGHIPQYSKAVPIGGEGYPGNIGAPAAHMNTIPQHQGTPDVSQVNQTRLPPPYEEHSASTFRM